MPRKRRVYRRKPQKSPAQDKKISVGQTDFKECFDETPLHECCICLGDHIAHKRWGAEGLPVGLRKPLGILPRRNLHENCHKAGLQKFCLTLSNLPTFWLDQICFCFLLVVYFILGPRVVQSLRSIFQRGHRQRRMNSQGSNAPLEPLL